MEEQNQNPNPAPVAPQGNSSDAEKNKGMAILAYIIFFIPLLAAKDSKFAMYHANQGLVLFLASIIIWIVSGIIPFIGWFIIGPLGSLAIIILAIIGIINAAKGEMKPLPLIGGFTILK
ncbi:MAG TPA: hypothetical protein PLK35_02930 [Candidatus Moranbacteria bacterium]|nr:hypothetical protein [Candidatus Moranbacteria bacterium]